MSAYQVESSNWVEHLRYRASQTPEKVAYIFLSDNGSKETPITYEQLDLRARALAVKIQQSILPGDRVLLLYPSGIEYLVGFFACLYAGVIAVPAYPPVSMQIKRVLPRLRALILDAKPKALLTVSSVKESLRTASIDTSFFNQLSCITTDSLDTSFATTWCMPDISGDDVAFLQYTSGSTSTPKGVMVTHHNLLSNHRMIQDAIQQPVDAPSVSWLPLFHDMGLIYIALQAVYVGTPCVLMSPMSFLLKPIRWLEAISRFRAYNSAAPNFAYDLCVQKITPEQRDTLDLSCWKIVANGSEPIRYTTLERFTEFFEPCGFQQSAWFPAYGLAEATVFVSGLKESRALKNRVVNATVIEHQSTGTTATLADPLSKLIKCGSTTWQDQRVLIVDPQTFRPCSPGQLGEIWVAGSHIAKGYWENPQATQQTFQAVLHTGEGPFLRTGDLGFLIDDEIIIAGRYKDLIIIEGINHYPQDVEYTVEQSHMGLRSNGSAAFSIEVDNKERLVIVAEVDRRYGRSTKGEVDKMAHYKAITDEITRSIRRAVTEYHALQVYKVLLIESGSLFKTSSGKVQRQACRGAFINQEFIPWYMAASDRNASITKEVDVAIPQAGS